jgi:hypothetical protein
MVFLGAFEGLANKPVLSLSKWSAALVKLLAIRLSPQAGKSLVMPEVI